MEEQQTKICPFCGKEILIKARKCKYCGNWLDVNNPEPCPQPEIEQTKFDIDVKPLNLKCKIKLQNSVPTAVKKFP